ncbi:hypothetical protein BVRB_9g218900 [Beta vulgaris subsp. vulgaris]|nr:hypothetical protein BVRB_9g218900 [Beta vulgaris subsp. vulgaris]
MATAAGLVLTATQTLLSALQIGMGSLIGLTRLTMFVLGRGSSNQVQFGQLRDLIPLVNLRGELTILFKEGCSYDVVNAEEGSYLSNKKYIKCVKLGHDEAVFDERWLEALKPHCDIREINIEGYKDVRLPSWAVTLASSFPLLVKVDLSYFNELEHMPRLSQLKHLRILKLSGMLNVEYMEDDNNGAILPFYPSLEELCLINFPKLKGWWREVGVEREAALSGVLTLTIEICPNLTSFPGCPKLKVVELKKFNDALTFCAGPNPSTSSDDLVYCLDKLTIDNVRSLNSLFGETLQGIYKLVIESSEVQNLSTIAEWCLKHASSIKSLKFSKCNNLMSLSKGGIEHMTNLEQLVVFSCKKLDLGGDDDGMPWSSLSYLNLFRLPKVVNLPKGIQYLYSLKILYINSCDSLDNLPEWLHRLTSLHYLELAWCPRLKSLPEAGLPNLKFFKIYNCTDELVERCRKPDGEDWPKISHIPHFRLE